MTDMHREAFERVCKYRLNNGITWVYKFDRHPKDRTKYESSMTRYAWEIWQAAIRHLTDQNEQRDSHE